MINRFSLLAAVAAAAMALPAGAVTYTSVNGAPDPGSPGETLLLNFEGAPPAGYTITGDFNYATGYAPGVAAAPAGDATRFLYVSPALAGTSATITTPDLTSVSFYWGSIDTYNSVDVLLSGGSVFSLSGSAFPPANGGLNNGLSNRRVFFTADPGETITGITFRSTGVAFEIDDVYGTLGAGSTIPEPQSWALLIAGFGLIGAAARRRRGAVIAS